MTECDKILVNSNDSSLKENCSRKLHKEGASSYFQKVKTIARKKK